MNPVSKWLTWFILDIILILAALILLTPVPILLLLILRTIVVDIFIMLIGVNWSLNAVSEIPSKNKKVDKAVSTLEQEVLKTLLLGPFTPNDIALRLGFDAI